jgi:ketosteroid isomerase-like protein
MFRLRSAAIAVAVLVAACHIEDRTPTGSRRDEDAVRSAVANYYRSLSTRDWSGSRALFWDSATVVLRHPAPDSAWREFRGADAYHRYLARTYAGDRNRAIAVRMFRLDTRLQGDLASAWVITRRRPLAGEGREEIGTADNLLLRHADGVWRIVSFASTPDVSPASH